MEEKRKRPHIQVECNTPFLLQLKLDIENIAANMGKTTAGFIKGLLVEAREKAPANLRRPYKKD